MTLTVRDRLTAWYTAVLLAVLAAFGGWVYVAERHLHLDALDAELRQAAAAAGAALADELDEGGTLAYAASEVYKDLAPRGRVLAILDGEGRPLSGEPIDLRRLGTAPDATVGAATLARGGEDWRLLIGPYRHGAVACTIVVGEPLARANAARRILRRTLMVGIPGALVLAGAGGWWIARRALSPLSSLAAQARRATGGRSGLRLEVPYPDDEIGIMARGFNDLLDRREATLEAQRRFMADASHELRTPVSIVQTTAQVILDGPRTEAAYRESLEVIGRQARRLARMVDDMMTLARADADELRLTPVDLYLDEVVAEAVRDVSLLAGRRVEVRAADAPETAFRGDELLLRQMVMNLLDNGIRHTPAGGVVVARLEATNGGVEITVADSGSGVPEQDRERIFERFVRLDPARGRTGGAGLGLPIARCIAEAHGGTLVLDRSGGGGSAFVVRLPRPGAAS